MFYITKKNTETGNKFTEIVKIKKKAFKDQKEFANKYGFETWRGGYWLVWGGISSCIDFKETPDKKIWGKGAKKGEYLPKLNSKAGKAIQKEIENLEKVSIYDLNNCIGFEEKHQKTIGFASSNDEYFGFVTDKKWNVKIPSDCKEVLESKYDELFVS